MTTSTVLGLIALAYFPGFFIYDMIRSEKGMLKKLEVLTWFIGLFGVAIGSGMCSNTYGDSEFGALVVGVLAFVVSWGLQRNR